MTAATYRWTVRERERERQREREGPYLRDLEREGEIAAQRSQRGMVAEAEVEAERRRRWRP